MSDSPNIPVPEIFSIKDDNSFEKAALEIFRFQASENTVYKDFIYHLNIEVSEVKGLKDIPFLPIELFKSQKVVTGNSKCDVIFSSSGTTGSMQSRHYVKNLSLYEYSFRKAFERFYGDVKQYSILALLPSYLEREGSSLIYMVEDLIEGNGNPQSGFYLNNTEELYHKLLHLKSSGSKVFLLGVTFALLDFAEVYQPDLSGCIIMETGGMKGRRKEMIREEVHEILSQAFKVDKIHSEYGMTELLSQGYSKGDGIFDCPPWMKVLIRDTNDPFNYLPEGRTGGINVIDLANVYSCSFIATQDLGRINEGGAFEVLGRFDYSDMRGCNLMIS